MIMPGMNLRHFRQLKNVIYISKFYTRDTSHRSREREIERERELSKDSKLMAKLK